MPTIKPIKQKELIRFLRRLDFIVAKVFDADYAFDPENFRRAREAAVRLAAGLGGE